MGKHLKFISSKYLNKYTSACKINWLEVFHKLRLKANFTIEDFEYYLIALYPALQQGVVSSRADYEYDFDEDYDYDDESGFDVCTKCGRDYDQIDKAYQSCSKCGWDEEKQKWGEKREPTDEDYMNGDADILTGRWW